jgi:hypothetical protein
MSAARIPHLHRAVAEAAVKAVLGERAVVKEMVEIPAGQPLSVHINALGFGIRTFWNNWTGRQSNERTGDDETQD